MAFTTYPGPGGNLWVSDRVYGDDHSNPLGTTVPFATGSVAHFHTHPYGYAYPSRGPGRDTGVLSAGKLNVVGYVISDTHIRRYDPDGTIYKAIPLSKLR